MKGYKKTNYFQFHRGLSYKLRAQTVVASTVHKKKTKKAIDNHIYRSMRAIQIRIKIIRGYSTVIGIYAASEGKEGNNAFYENLHNIINNVSKPDMLHILYE